MDQLSSSDLPDNATYCSAQDALQTMVQRLYRAISGTYESLEIEYVCLFGGVYQPNDALSNLGLKVKTLCSTQSEVLIFPIAAAETHRLLEFMNKVVYVDLNMNSTSETSNPVHGQNADESDLTVIAESCDNIRRIRPFTEFVTFDLGCYVCWRQDAEYLCFGCS